MGEHGGSKFLASTTFNTFIDLPPPPWGGGGQAKFFASFFVLFLQQIFWYIFNKLAFLALLTMAVLTENTKKTKELLEN